MYQLGDTITQVSSAPSGSRLIIRLSGTDAFKIIQKIFTPLPKKPKSGIYSGQIITDGEMMIDSLVYLFPSPHSYTGEDVAEIHFSANQSVCEALLDKLLAERLRAAGPGEFTARSYLNGKIDLTQAEAVNSIIVSSNKFQLDASEKLLKGRLTQTIDSLSKVLLDCLSLMEAGMDFSEQDIVFFDRFQMSKRLLGIKDELEKLISQSVSCEEVIDLPSVGVAGVSNAGKSRLFNKLLAKKRSIVSSRKQTTRDVLAAQLMLEKSQCVLFDCAGLASRPSGVIHKLAQQAAIEAIANSDIIIFCVDISKSDKQLKEDISARRLINPKSVISAATKTDLLTPKKLDESIARLSQLFGADFLPISAKTGFGIDNLKKAIDEMLIKISFSGRRKGRFESISKRASGISLTTRHRQALTEAIENISRAASELKAENDEIASMLIRSAVQSITSLTHQHITDEILSKIFSNFCIGK
jgi:tRNA modification GTPase